jgi:hypothetical protein
MPLGITHRAAQIFCYTAGIEYGCGRGAGAVDEAAPL